MKPQSEVKKIKQKSIHPCVFFCQSHALAMTQKSVKKRIIRERVIMVLPA